MKSRLHFRVAIGVGLALALAACAPAPASPTPTPEGYLATVVAQTQTALASPQEATATPSSTPSSTPSPIPPTPTPTLTPTVTDTPVPSPTPTPTPTPIPCNRAQFIRDVTVSDDTVFSPGVDFTKTWRVRNTGACTWTPEYDLVFDDGDWMGGPAAVSLNANVRPGETVDLSVDLEAPDSTGDYEGFWLLRDAGNVLFGLGEDADQPLQVEIVVAIPSDVAFNFVEDFCDARWRNAFERLDCPGREDQTEGFVIRLPTPRLENGVEENEPALYTRPEFSDLGFISGRYPAFDVQAGDHFMTVVGCLFGAPGCRVTFALQYRIGQGPVQTLARWTETYDGRITRVDVDLTPLAGESVEFILLTSNTGDWQENQPFWLLPRIVR